MNHTEVFEKVYETYCKWYDMERCGEEKTPLAATGRFHSTDVAYLLIEKAKMWSADSNDYLYIFCLDNLTAGDFSKLAEEAKLQGEKLVSPSGQHRSSYITALFICKTADKDASDALIRYRYRKDFAFGFKGWEELHAVLFTTDNGSICSNRDGKNTAEFVRNMFFPKKKGFFNRIKGV